MGLESVKKLLSFIEKSPSAFHAMEEVEKRLLSEGFQVLNEEEKWSVSPQGKYFVTKNNSAIIAFQVGDGKLEKNGYRMIGAHADSPCFRIKPSPEMVVENHYMKINTAPYGGMIMSSWFDRPLGIAGRILLKGKSPLKPEEKLICIRKPILIIPNLAIHFNRDINNGYSYNPQKDTLPILAFVNETFEKNNYLLTILAEEIGVSPENILDFELNLFEIAEGTVMGANNEFISASRLDDLWMVYASLESFLASKENESGGMKVIYYSDNEEVGSLTAQGAESSFLRDTLDRIIISLGKSKEDFYRMIKQSTIISADLAHGAHPNYSEIHDPTTRPVLGKGPVLKYSVSQKYATTAYSAAVFTAVCEKAGVSMQKFINRSDLPGGSTIGSMVAADLAAKVVDMGAPLLAMHSIRELAAVKDHEATVGAFTTFFEL